jgi:hypothetical protein
MNADLISMAVQAFFGIFLQMEATDAAFENSSNAA